MQNTSNEQSNSFDEFSLSINPHITNSDKKRGFRTAVFPYYVKLNNKNL